MNDSRNELDQAPNHADRPPSSRLTSQDTSNGSESTLDLPNTSHHPIHAERSHFARLQHVHTVSSRRTSRPFLRTESQALPKFGGGKPYPPEIPAEREDYVVDFEDKDDPLHPMNWKFSRKIVISAIGALACLCSTFASSLISPATGAISKHFGIGIEVGSLSSALYLAGYGVGPAVWAPLSELQGRKLPLVLGSFGFSVFAVAVAVAKDVQTVMISRFFMGVFGSSPLVVVAAMYADIWCAEQRGIALVVFACSVFVGPMLAPFIGAFTVMTPYLGWRWDSYWSAIMGFFTLFLIVCFVKESYSPVVLISKAASLRRRTRNWAIHAKQEEIEINLRELIQKNVARPIQMLFSEPILLLIGFYITFVYGLIYISLSAFPLVFTGVRHIKPGVAELPFLGMLVGMLLAGATSIAMNPSWVRKYHANQNRAEPEWRLPLAAAGSVVFTIGLFWFGWTGYYESVHWAVPTVAGIFVGYGLLAIFMQLIMYIVESYLMFAASALAGNTILRSLFAASCPLFDRQMFNGMHLNWGFTLLGCLALVLTPVPLAFIKYGPAIRKKSKWAPTFGPPGTDTKSKEEDFTHEKEEGEEN